MKTEQAEIFIRELIRQNHPVDDEDYSVITLDYDTLITKARESLMNGKMQISCGNNDDMCYALQKHSEVFWQACSVITGLPLPPGHSSFSCSC